MPFDEIAAELAAAARGRWRMELLETDDGITILNDAYNANPASMEAALVALAHLPGRGPAHRGARRDARARRPRRCRAPRRSVRAPRSSGSTSSSRSVRAPGSSPHAARAAGVQVDDALRRRRCDRDRRRHCPRAATRCCARRAGRSASNGSPSSSSRATPARTRRAARRDRDAPRRRLVVRVHDPR